MHTKGGQRRRLKPMQQWRFVKERNAVEARRQPVAADQHPAPHLAVAAFIGHGQRAQGGHQQQKKPQSGQGQPGFLTFG